MTAGPVGWRSGLPALQWDPSSPAIASRGALWPPGTHLDVPGRDTRGWAALLGLASVSAFPDMAFPGSCLRGGVGHGN